MSLNKSVLIDISTGPNKKQMTKDDKSERHTHTHTHKDNGKRNAKEN